ncbi:MAG: MFS transporter [Loktanella sp.]|nr:MFS transporter [Loktanella sp.]
MSSHHATFSALSKPYLILALLWLVGWTLRVPILAAPPLATHMAESLDLGTAGVGAVTMLPVIAVALGAVPAAWLIARIGLRTAVVTGICVMVVASTVRGQVPSAALLFAASLIMGLGVALFQTALPAATRVWTPTHVALGSAVYLNGMMVGELSAAGLTLPVVLPLAGGDWQLALVLWAVPVTLIAVMVMVARLPQDGASSATDKLPGLSQKGALPRWNDARVWQYGVLLGSSVVSFYVVNAYAGSVLQARGETDALSGFYFAYNAMPLLGSVAILIAPQWIGSRRPIAIAALITAAGLAGFVFFEGWTSWVSALIVGFAATVQLVLLTSLPPSIATGIAVTRLSAGMTLIGFALAFLLPLIGGSLAEATGRIEAALIPALIFMIAALAALGLNARYPRYE